MEYRIIASSVYEPAHLERVIIDWYHRPSKPGTTPSSLPTTLSHRLSTAPQQSSLRRATVTSPITTLATRHPILGKGGISKQSTTDTSIQARISASAKSTVPISSQTAFSKSTGELEIGSGIRVRKISSMGDLNHDYFFWQENTFLLVDLFSGQHRWVNLKAGWDGSRQGKPAPVNLGDFNMNQVTTKSVANMTTVERIAEAMKRAAYKAPDYFKQVILDMISPENLAIIMLFAAAQATPFGWVADAAAIISAVWAFRGRLEEIHALGKAIAEFIDLSLHAQTDAEMDRAADDFVIIVTSGYDLLKLIITKRGGKLRQGEQRHVVTTRNNSGTNAPAPKAKAHDEPPVPKAKKPKQVTSEPIDEWPKISGIVRDASKSKGNFGLGKATHQETMKAGEAWVGPGYDIASDGKTLVSKDGLRQFRPPTKKPRLGKVQANFEWRNKDKGAWQGNGHLDVE